MTRDVTVLNRTQKVQLIHLTMQGLQSKIYYLYENYNSYHENYSDQRFDNDDTNKIFSK